jgi:DNA-binding NtrC family response regulator
MTVFRLSPDQVDENTRRFVIVDDSEEVLQIWKRVFQQEGKCLCFLTSNPWDALQEIEILKPDVLITDLLMPGLSGFQLAKKAKDIHPSLQVFLTTGSPNQLKEYDFLEDILEVLQKPYMNIENVQHFVHDLATQQPLDRSHCVQNGKFNMWNL